MRWLCRPVLLGHRSQHPAEDPFNAYLNYGYGILYNEIERACIFAGLDPYAGFLHADRYGNKALVYDLVEMFRQPVNDRVILNLAASGLMEETDLDEKGWLSADSKRRVITAVISRLDDDREIQGKQMTFRGYIKASIHGVARYLSEGKALSRLTGGGGDVCLDNL